MGKSTTECRQGCGLWLLLFSSGAFGLECWMGGCGRGTNSACSEDAYPSLEKTNCTESFPFCFKGEAYADGKLSREFGCWGDDSVGLGCHEQPDQDGLTDISLCVCDTALCNTAASKHVF